MDFNEIIIDRESFNQNWTQKKICGYCEINHLNQTYEQYLLNGNICKSCRTKINEKFMKSLKEEKQKRLQAKVDRLEVLGNQLEDDLGEDERKEIVSEMMILSKSIKVDEANIELL